MSTMQEFLMGKSICPVQMSNSAAYKSRYSGYGTIRDEEFNGRFLAEDQVFNDCAIKDCAAKNCTFKDCAITGGEFQSCTFDDVEITGALLLLSCDISNAKVNDNVPLTNCKLVETTLVNTRALDCIISNCEMQKGTYIRCNISEVTEKRSPWKMYCEQEDESGSDSDASSN